jgi:hypothetical protein
VRIGGSEVSNIEDKMNEFIPGIVEDQRRFYQVASDGSVTGWWLVPNRYTSTISGPTDDHPLGNTPRPGWYDEIGTPLPCDPREKTR